MTIRQVLFSFNGRLNRLPFFGYSVLAVVALFVVIGLGVTLCFSKEVTGVILGSVVMLAGFPVAVWSVYALLVKRLHDLDMSGLHAIWFYLLGIAPSAFATEAPVLAAICGLAQFGFSLYFLFAPGTVGQNRFGQPRVANASAQVTPALA
jgi:uncharacterized membrane protein YhaH (DUF805 family)